MTPDLKPSRTKPRVPFALLTLLLLALAILGPPIGAATPTHAQDDFGAGDTLELARPGAPALMVPFTRAAVPSIELASGRLVLDPPPGLLDETEA